MLRMSPPAQLGVVCLTQNPCLGRGFDEPPELSKLPLQSVVCFIVH